MISLDLKNLPAIPPDLTLGACKYNAPCIIGSLMTVEERQKLVDENHNISRIMTLVEDGVIYFPRGQANLAYKLQRAFDDGDTNPLGYQKTYIEVLTELETLP